MKFLFKNIIVFIFYLGVFIVLLMIIFFAPLQDIVDFSRRLVTFNITFSIGFAAVLVATMTIFQNEQRKDNSVIRLMLNDILLFNGVNLLLLMISYIKYENLNEKLKEVYLIITIIWLCLTVLAATYLIFRGRDILNKMFIKKD